MGRPSDPVVRGDACTPQRSLFHVLGLTEEELNQPLIGVVSAYSEIVPEHLHLDKITEAVKARIRMADDTPIMVPSIGVCNDIAMGRISMKYSLASRELVIDGVETMAEAHGFDGLVLVPDYDKIAPGMLMGVLRVNMPSAVMSSGAMPPGNDREKAISLSAMFEVIGAEKVGLIDQTKLTHIEQNACPGCDFCSGMFTASSMNCLCEVLGIALSGNGTIPTVYSTRTQLAKKADVAVMDMMEKDIRPRDVVNEKSLRNGLTCDIALSCSPNTILRLLAIAKEAKMELDLDIINEVSQRTSNLCKLAPAGPGHIMDLYNTGGVQAVMKELSGRQLIGTSPVIITGKTVTENIAATVSMDTNIIEDIKHPNSATGGIIVLFGGIAPKGYVVKRSAVDPKMMTHIEPARVFDGEEAAIEAICAGSIVEGDVIVIHYEGPKGGPGMQEMLNPTSAPADMQLDKNMALITDGHFSGATRSTTIGHVSPEATVRGPTAIIQEGNSITIDIPNNSISLNVDATEVEQHLQAQERQKPKIREGWLYRYSRFVASADEGAVLK